LVLPRVLNFIMVVFLQI